ncbi:uncharacterized protein BO80DRAFT_213728 [Aspergillus ibericus CBS 121593]|uniref:Uncharacterized protein n=1 Tax=Aspergillus ibericus CBS 121593 TaxID=1448316 RepID=A0A395GMW9_9EURO|nr:hypothetical protein BO80DRAFT_213728 [Aspergillus ibericus CBS 121593]RAK96860.1 hypothetical protein BO80DRAFT_213728 [Aspergillus ibericus CBS 121593]
MAAVKRPLLWSTNGMCRVPNYHQSGSGCLSASECLFPDQRANHQAEVISGEFEFLPAGDSVRPQTRLPRLTVTCKPGGLGKIQIEPAASQACVQ